MCRPAYIAIFTSVVILSVLVISCQRYISEQQQQQTRQQQHQKQQQQSGVHRVVRDVTEEVQNDSSSSPPPHKHSRRHKEFKTMKENMTKLQRKVEKLEQDLRETKKYVSEHQRGGKCSDALCPTGAIRFGCQCYMFVLHERMKWEDARGYCHRMGGSLLYVGSQGVSKNIKRFVKGNLGRRGMQKVNFYTCLIHTTAHDSNPAYLEQHKGSKRADGWYWQRGIGLKNKPLDKNIGDKFWAAKISNDHVSAGFEPSCMVLNGTDTFKWHAVYCSSENNFICEWKATPVRRTRKGKRRKSEDTETGENRRTKGDTTSQQKGGQEDGEAMSDDETGLENKKSKENVRDSERENG